MAAMALTIPPVLEREPEPRTPVPASEAADLQLTSSRLLGGVLAIAVLLAGLLVQQLAPQNPLAGALIGSALAVPFMLLLWLVRRICYVLKQPATAVLGSAAYFLLISVGLGLAWIIGKVT